MYRESHSKADSEVSFSNEGKTCLQIVGVCGGCGGGGGGGGGVLEVNGVTMMVGHPHHTLTPCVVYVFYIVFFTFDIGDRIQMPNERYDQSPY